MFWTQAENIKKNKSVLVDCLVECLSHICRQHEWNDAHAHEITKQWKNVVHQPTTEWQH